MTDDLFVKKSDKDMLLDFIRQKQWVKTSEVLAWGLRNYSNRAERNARALAKEGKIKRMPDNFKAMRFGNIKEDVWEWCGE